MKKKYKAGISLLTLIVVLFAGSRFVMYGSILRTCEYVATDISVPSELQTGGLVTTKESIRIHDYTAYSCAGTEFTDTSSITEIGYAYIYKDNITSIIPEATTFKVAGIKEVTKHGIGTIDSGSGSLYFLILTDKKGDQYFVSPVNFGINDSDNFMSFVENTGTTHIIGPDNFFDRETRRFSFDLSAE